MFGNLRFLRNYRVRMLVLLVGREHEIPEAVLGSRGCRPAGAARTSGARRSPEVLARGERDVPAAVGSPHRLVPWRDELYPETYLPPTGFDGK